VSKVSKVEGRERGRSRVEGSANSDTEVVDPSFMCTLIAIHRRLRGAPLVVAANRDEYYDRPAEPPALRGSARGREGDGGPIEAGCGPVVAPLDLRAGGTWLGVNAMGVFAAVTNLRSETPDPARRSRGMVVMDALREPTAARSADFLKALSEEAYNPFNCFVADRERAFRLTYRDAPRLRELPAGVHVIGNADPEDGPVAKTERVRAAVEDVVDRGGDTEARDDVLGRLASVCREHPTGERGIADTCVHLGAYGTRSSALLWMADEHSARRLLFADGPPCEVEYEDFSPLLHEQSQRARYIPGETAARTVS
jgi:uncharacterized protein with NRDE domain